MRNNTRTQRMRKKTQRPAKDPLRNEDVLPGWYWRAPEGQALIKMISAQSPADLVDDPEIGWQREKD
jgi:hypothetical protein